ncbi:MAG: response regulator [bacterium]|nr:response regulator [bacterium]
MKFNNGNPAVTITAKVAIILFFLLSLFPALNYCQGHGLKYIRNFDTAKLGFHPQNWSVLQDKRGFIYVGNHYGILEFDGVSWRNIDLPNWSVSSLSIDEKGTIYVGGNNELGFLAPDETGALVYQSLLRHIPSEKQDFSNIWETYCVKGMVYFCASRFLFIWNPAAGTMKTLDVPLEINGSFNCAGNYFVHQRALGLMELVDDSLQLAPNGAAMKNKTIYFMALFRPGTYLLGTRQEGFHLYDYRNGTFTPFPTEADEYIRKHRLYQGIRLSHSPGTFAVATLQGGMVVIDAKGGIKDIFTKSNGLMDNNVKFVFEDKLGNLWLGLNEGVSRIEYAPSPISYYDESSGLAGILLAGLRGPGGKDFYVGTTSGLFVTAPPQAAHPYTMEKKFIPVSGISDACFDLLAIGDSVLAGTIDGLFKLDTRSRRITQLNKLDIFVLQHSRSDKKRLWVGTGSGLQSFYLGGGLSPGLIKPEHTFKTFNLPVRSIVEDEKGTLWLGITGQGVTRVDFSSPFTIDNPGIIQYDENHGLPPKAVSVFFAAGRVRFGTDKGLYVFDEKTGRFRHDPLLGDSFTDGARNVFRLVEDHRGHLWFHSAEYNHRAVPRPNGSFRIDSRSFLRLPQIQVNVIYPEGDIIWFLANNSLIRYDSRIEPAGPVDFPIFIRRLKTGNQVVFNGYDQNNFAPVLRFDQKNIRFNYAAPFYQEESKTRYAYFLEGYDNQWSQWSLETQKDYTNLDAGSYRFRVKAKNIYHDVSRESSFQFKVLPPWYRTWWAYGFYLLVLAGVGVVAQKYYAKKLAKARSIAHRERAVSQRLRQVDKLKDEIMSNTSHELRTPLHGIIGLAESLIDGVTGELPPDTVANLAMISSSGKRLVNLVNDILDFSSLKNSSLDLDKKTLDLYALTEVVLTLTQPLVGAKDLALVNSISPGAAMVEADENRLQQILYNLVGNAVKFADTGNITISADVEDQWMVIRVSDTGIGIHPEDYDRIFESFEQVEGALDRKYGGTGVGLAVTKQLVELHGGQITLESVVGKGSTFSFTLPPAAEEAGEEPKPGIPIMREEHPEEPAEPGEKPPIQAGPVPEVAPGEKAYHILVVDDEPVNRRVLINYLSLQNFRVSEAENGHEALRAVNGPDSIDLVLLDIMMPRMSGYEVCRKLREHYSPLVLPIFFLTAKSRTADLETGFNVGANDFIPKPVSRAELLARVHTHLKLQDINLHMEQIIATRTQQLREYNTQITSSIRYAQTIQESILPSAEEMLIVQPHHFVIFKPKDIVSGDFYWLYEDEDNTCWAVVDCTGHGVPGGFMSMMGYTLLNKIIIENGIADPAIVLEQLNTEVRRALKQADSSRSTDGMDMVLCFIQKNKGRIAVAGARNPLYLAKMNGKTTELVHLKGNRKSIGGRMGKHVEFDKHQLEYSPGDMIYMISDGFADQRGKNGNKFSSRRFRELLESIAHHPVNTQKELLEKELSQHQGTEEQVDDITIIGVKL